VVLLLYQPCATYQYCHLAEVEVVARYLDLDAEGKPDAAGKQSIEDLWQSIEMVRAPG
jgi:hypothetical protein